MSRVCLEQIGQVAHVSGDGTAVTAFGDVRRTVSLVILEMEAEPVEPGNWLVAHSGVAVRKVSEDEAAELLRARAEAEGREP